MKSITSFGSTSLFALLALFCGITGPGIFMSIPLSPWFQLLFALLLSRPTLLSIRWTIARFLLIWFLFGVGAGTSYSTLLDFNGAGIIAVYGICFVLMLPIVFTLIIDRIVILRLQKYSELSHITWIGILLFPTLFVSYHLLLYNVSPFGSLGSYAYSQAPFSSFVQVASLFGTNAIVFLMALFASVIERDIRSRYEPTTSQQKTQIKTMKKVLVVLLIATITYGAVRTAIVSKQFPPRPLSETYEDPIPVTCLIDGDISRTLDAASRGSKLILWSEMSGSPSDVQRVLEQVHTQYPGVIVGVTYSDTIDEKHRNVLSVIDEKGIAFTYFKAHPVPLVEKGVVAGPAKIPTIEHTWLFGKIGAAICFDFDFPAYIAQAGRDKVDLMLDPSWTWANFGDYHATMSSFRAIEQGFTLFRCSRDGASALYNPLGERLAYRQDRTDGDLHALMPPPHRSFTLYSVIGDTFSYLCLVWSLIVIITSFLPSKFVERVFKKGAQDGSREPLVNSSHLDKNYYN